MPVEIHAVHPEYVCLLPPKSVDYLKSAHHKFFGEFDVLEKARTGHGTIYEVTNDGIIIGCFYLRFIFNHLGKVMDLVLIGGEFDSFYKELEEFLYRLFKAERCDKFTYLGRRGFSRFFPFMNEAATLYFADEPSFLATKI